jgi:hypothetical protein
VASTIIPHFKPHGHSLSGVSEHLGKHVLPTHLSFEDKQSDGPEQEMQIPWHT